MNLEDETGMINVVISVGCWQKHAAAARGSSALIVRGRVERAGDVTNLVADNLERLPLAATTRSRDFR
jgi:error-prone DNA polymerase